MILLGLSGKAGSGKDSVAAYLKQQYGFIPFSFSDTLYREVVSAFDLPDEDLLRDRATKEVPTKVLCGENCSDPNFVSLLAGSGYVDRGDAPRSPRQILQMWGTNYRRAQDPDYWIKKAEAWLEAILKAAPYPELRPQLFVCSSVRFENEREWIKDPNGSIWHLRRFNAAPVHAHESENELPVLEGERVIYNNYTLDYLHRGVDQLLSSSAKFVRMEPPLPMTAPDLIDDAEGGN